MKVLITIFLITNLNPSINHKENLIKMIKKWEGLKLTIYDDNGYDAIGYGCRYFKNLDTITEAQADSLLREQFDKNLAIVKKRFFDLNYTQYLALADISFNWGIGNLIKSNLIKKNQIDTNILFHYRKVDELPTYRKRREYDLFLFNYNLLTQKTKKMEEKFKKLFLLLEKKRNFIEALEEKQFETKGIIVIDNNEFDINKSNEYVIKTKILPYLLSLKAANKDLKEAGISEIKIRNYPIESYIEDSKMKINKLKLSELKKEYDKLYNRIFNNKGIPEDLKIEFSNKELFKDLENELNKLDEIV